MMEKGVDLICMGRVGVDLYAEQINSPLKDVESFRKYLGGSPGNISVGVSRLGLKTALFSAVGTDEMGQFLKSQLIKEGVDTTMLIESDRHLTALAILGICPPDRFPLIFYRHDCADMQLKTAHIDQAMIEKAKAFQFSGTGISSALMRETTRAALIRCKAHGVKVILDIDYRPVLWGLSSAGDGETRYKSDEKVSRYYQDFLPFCDIVVGTDEELCIAAGVDHPYQAIAKIQTFAKVDVVYKTGLAGSEVHLFASKEIISQPAFVVDVFNTLGAGDAYLSGLLRGLLTGMNWSESLVLANACGALVCARHGCSPAMPSFKELKYFIEGYKQLGKAVVFDANLERLHAKVGIEKRNPIALLAYDHRWQFEKSADEHGRDYDCIAEFKKAIYQGFKVVKSRYKGNLSLGVICDWQYGADVLAEAACRGDLALSPLEAANSYLSEWIDEDKGIDEQICRLPATQGLKFLWRFHPDMSIAQKAHQLQRLKQAYLAAKNRDRRLMLELIVPAEYDFNIQALSQSIEMVYRQGIYPHWWKLQALSNRKQWRQLEEIISRHDVDARMVVLGGLARELDDYAPLFETITDLEKVDGFAFGRSIFWS
ncbi:MAG: 5-dehydro-2-deoxygluconokinase, partial [Francisellaceae bacterium]